MWCCIVQTLAWSPSAVHRVLGEQEEILKQAVHEARKRQEAAEAAATPEERVALFAARKDKAKQLSHQQASLRAPAAWQAN